MSAVATPLRPRPPLIRRFVDRATGQVVTYLPSAQLLETIQISATTLHRWVEQGHVRFTESLGGGRNYAVVDAARIRSMTPKQSQALGLRRCSDAYTAASRDWFNDAQAETGKTAKNLRHPWCDYDIQFVLDNYTTGRPIEEIALVLERTYSSIAGMVDRLKSEGEIPWSRQETDAWMETVRSLLTDEELASLTEILQ